MNRKFKKKSLSSDPINVKVEAFTTDILTKFMKNAQPFKSSSPLMFQVDLTYNSSTLRLV